MDSTTENSCCNVHANIKQMLSRYFLGENRQKPSKVLFNHFMIDLQNVNVWRMYLPTENIYWLFKLPHICIIKLLCSNILRDCQCRSQFQLIFYLTNSAMLISNLLIKILLAPDRRRISIQRMYILDIIVSEWG